MRCGLCLLGCPDYQVHRDELHSAKGRNMALAAGLSPRDVEASFYSCTLCGYCDRVCPRDIDNTGIVRAARGPLEAGSASPVHAEMRANLAMRGSPYGDREPAGGAPAAPPGSRPASALAAATGGPGGRGGDVLWVGCQARDQAPGLVAAASKVLERSAIAVRVLPGERCCGAPLEAAGDPAGAARMAGEVRALVGGAGRVIALAASCGRALAGALGPSRVVTLFEVWARSGGRGRRGELVQVPCQLVNDDHDRFLPLAEAVEGEGRTSIDTVKYGHCCGGGIPGVAPDRAFVAERVRQVVGEHAPAGILTGCASCFVAYRDHAGVPVSYLGEAVDGPAT